MKEATAPNSPPTSSEPIASGIGEFQYVAAAMQAPATVTPSTAAISSRSTTLTSGVEPLFTEMVQDYILGKRKLVCCLKM